MAGVNAGHKQKKAGKARQIIIKREEYVAGKSITVLKGSER